MISQAPAVEQLSGISPASIPEEVLSAREPVVLKGLVADWPVVSAARDGDASLLDYLRGTCRDRDILAFRSLAGQGGRYFYNEESKSLGHKDALGHQESLAWFKGKLTPDRYCDQNQHNLHKIED